MILEYVNDNYLYEHANIRSKVTGQPFDIWVDEFGKTRNNKHNEPRYKVTANDVELDIILHGDDSIEIVNDTQDIRKFKHSKEAVEFIEKFKLPFRMQWDQQIDTYELTTIIRLTQKQGFDIIDAIDKVLRDDF